MKNYFKIIGVLVLSLALPVQAAIMTLNLDQMIIAQPVVLPSTSGSSDAISTQPIQPLNKIVLQNTTLNLEPLAQLQQEFKTFNPNLMSKYELQIYNDLEKQLALALQPKIFTVDEKTFEQSLERYRADRVEQIKRENAGNIAEINDQLGVLDDEVANFSLTLREQLQAKAILMEKEQEQLVLNLQLSLNDFKTFYQEKETDSAVRSGSLTESSVVAMMPVKLTAAADTYKEVEQKQSDLLTAISAAKTDVADDSLKSVYLTNIEMQIQKDTATINVMLSDLQDQREKIVTLSNDIKLLSDPLASTGTAATNSYDKLVQEEQLLLLANKELQLQKELENYYQMQTETQLVINSSLTNLNTFTLK